MSLIESVNTAIYKIRSYTAYRSIIKKNWPELDNQLAAGPYNRYAENLYLFINKLTIRPCCRTCNKELLYIDRTVGYRKYCSSKCSAINENTKHIHKSNYDSKTFEQKQHIINKRKSTMMNLYGVEHALQNLNILEKFRTSYNKCDQNKIKTKRKSTIKQKYNVDNIWDSQEVRNKVKKTNLEKYGNEWGLQNIQIKLKSQCTRNEKFYNNLQTRVTSAIPLFTSNEFVNVSKKYLWRCKECFTEFIDHIDDGSDPVCPSCFPIGYMSSTGERELVNYIKNDLGITKLIQNSKELIYPKEIDIWLPDYNIAIEYHGLYWHSELKIKNKLYHQHKFLMCESLGIKLIQIFDDEWMYYKDKVKSKLDSILKFNINNQLEFYESSNGIWETIIDIDTSIDVVQIQNFINNKNPLEIIIYIDLRWDDGNILQSFGFNIIELMPPKFFYTNDGINRIHNSKITNKSYRVWNAGYKKLSWKC